MTSPHATTHSGREMVSMRTNDQLVGTVGLQSVQPELVGTEPGHRMERVVSLAPGTTEMLIHLGLEAKAVGVTRQCRFPEVAGKDIVGSFVRPDLERVHDLHPDLVLALEHVHGSLLNDLVRDGTSVLLISAETVEGILQGMELAGHILGGGDEANRVVNGLRSRIARVREKARSGAGVRVFRFMHDDPLRTSTSASHQYDAIRLAGGIPMPLESEEPYTTVPWQQVADFDPEVIVSCGISKGEEPKPRCPTCKKERPLCRRVVQQIASWEGWRDTTAARTGGIVPVPCHLLCRPGPRVVDGIEMLARLFSSKRVINDAEPFGE